MADEVFFKVVDRIKEYAQLSNQKRINIVFHGGEPCLIGYRQLDEWCTYMVQAVGSLAKVRFTIQTNGTLIDAGWIDVFKKHQITVGISLDGPKEVHDNNRVDFAGRGSYDKIISGIELLKQSDIVISILSVMPFGQDAIRFHTHLEQLGVETVDYIFPDFTHDTVGVIKEQYGDTPCADFLIPIFDYWWNNTDLKMQIEPFIAISKSILGGCGHVDFLGNRPFGFVFVESNGDIEGLDVLRVCENGIASTGLNVFNAGFHKIAEGNGLHSRAVFTGIDLPEKCHGCIEQISCGGGYLPHRYSSKDLFNNPSVWCADLLKIFSHIRHALNVNHDETEKRYNLLEEAKMALSDY